MKSSVSFLSHVICFSFIFSLVSAQQCSHDGVDYSALRANDGCYKAHADAADFWMNICDNAKCSGIPDSCTQKGPAVAYQNVLKNTSSGEYECFAVGKLETGEWNSLVDGHGSKTDSVVYKGDDQREIMYLMVCDPGLEVHVEIIGVAEQRRTTIAWKSMYGCRDDDDDGLGIWSIIFIILLVGLVLYCGIGAFYKRRNLGVSGVELIPNIEVWREVPGHFKSMADWSVNKVRHTFFPSGYQPLR